MRQILSLNDRQLSIQLGNYNVNIGEGKEIHIGDRIYQQWDKEAMEALVKTIQKTSGIHQNTQGGDTAGRDIDKRNVYENCIFFQLVAKDSNFDRFSQEFFQDLDFSGIPSESIQKAYPDSLPPDADVWDLPPPEADVSDLVADNIEAILKKLKEFRQLSQFFERLSQDRNLPIEIRQRIANQLASRNYPENHNNKSATDFSCNQSEPLESYLIATLSPGNGDDKFLLNAWLIIDDSVEGLSKFQSLLDQNEQQAGKLCKLTQIPTELNNFLEKALRYLIRRKYNLTIKIFLPKHLMYMEIDRWKITDPIVDDITLGIKYPVRLRSLERLKPNYLYSYLSQWYQSWDKVRDILQNEPTQEKFEHLQEIESFNYKFLSRKLKEKIGLKVIVLILNLSEKIYLMLS